MNHTPTPWKVVKGHSTCGIFPEPALMGNPYLGIYIKEADAERIVECVNALEGIDNPAEWVKCAKDQIRINQAHEAEVIKWENTMGALLGEDAPEPVLKRICELLEKESELAFMHQQLGRASRRPNGVITSDPGDEVEHIYEGH